MVPLTSIVLVKVGIFGPAARGWARVLSLVGEVTAHPGL